MNLSYYEQEKTKLRQRFKKAIRKEEMSSKQFVKDMRECFRTQTIPKEYFASVLEAGVLQLILWSIELEMEKKDGS